MLIKGQDASRIRFGNSFDNDQHHGERFDYLLANLPFGVEWRMVADTIRGEHKTRGFAGRFGAGLPPVTRCCWPRTSVQSTVRRSTG